MSSSWLIGSVKSMPAQTMAVNASGSENITVATGDYYLYDPTAAISLISTLATQLNTHTNLSDVALNIREDRRIVMTSTTAFALTWTNTVIRDLLGYTGNLTSGTSHVATNISPLLWSPGKNEIPDARLGTDGWYVYDTAVGQAGPGRVTSTRKNRYRRNRFRWTHCESDRVWDASESNGTYFVFFDEVLARFYNFKIYRQIAESSGTSNVDLSAASYIPSANGYVMAPASFPVQMPYSRHFPGKEYLHPVDLAVVEAPEYDNS